MLMEPTLVPTLYFLTHVADEFDAEMLNDTTEVTERQSCDSTSILNQPAQQQPLWWALPCSSEVNALLVSSHIYRLVSLYKEVTSLCHGIIVVC